jgi:L-Ala-D/L-Glu epimerase
MKITKVEAIPFVIPFRPDVEPSKWASGGLDKADHVLIRVSGEDGLVGYGEATPRPGFYGESQRGIVVAVEEFYRDQLKGMDVLDAEKISGVLDRYPANNTARGALDVAIHDLKARFLGVPLYKLLGGWHPGKVPVAANVSIKKKMESSVEEAIKFVAMGLKTLKVKVGGDPKKDLALIRAIRKGIGEDIDIYVDANQGWDRRSALWALPRMVDEGVFMVEEPVPSTDIESKLLIAKTIRMLILLDESVFTIQDVVRELKLGAVGRISVKTPRTGIMNSQKIIRTAEMFHIACSIGTQAETGVGTIASAHNGAAYRNVVGTELANYLKWSDDILVERPKFENGFLILPEGPGLGIEIDQKKLKKYRV